MTTKHQLPCAFQVEAIDAKTGLPQFWHDDNYMVASNRFYRLANDRKWSYVRWTSKLRGVLKETDEAGKVRNLQP